MAECSSESSTTMSELSQVRTFLDSLLGSSRCLVDLPMSALQLIVELSNAYTEQERQTSLVLELISSEKRRLECELTRLRHVVNKSTVSSVSTVHTLASILAKMADVLDVEEPSFDALVLALAHLRLRVAKMAVAKTHPDNDAHALNVITESERLRKEAKHAFKETQRLHEQASSSASKLSFLNDKRLEYETSLEKQRRRLHREPLITHDQLLALHQELEERERALMPLKKRLEALQELPPDLHLAKLKVAQAKERLEQLDRELGDKISQLQL